MRPRSTVWRAASLAGNSHRESYIGNSAKLAVCYRARRAQKTPSAPFRNCCRESRLTCPLSRWPTVKNTHQQRTRSSSSIIGN